MQDPISSVQVPVIPIRQKRRKFRDDFVELAPTRCLRLKGNSFVVLREYHPIMEEFFSDDEYYDAWGARPEEE